MKKDQTVKFSEVALSVLLIITISAITFLPFIQQLGFYGDDWIMVWGFMTSGSEKVASIYATDRPFTGLIVGKLFTILGVEPIHWQIFIFINHVISSLLFFWLVRMVWEKQKIPTLLMAIVFSTYPGFLQSPQALTYQALFLGVNFGLFGTVLGLSAVHTPKNVYKILFFLFSFGFFLACLLMVEWLIGILAVFVILVFYGLKKYEKMTRPRIVRTIYYSLPALLASGAFLVWRIFFFQNRRLATDIGQIFLGYRSQSISRFFNLFFDTLRSFANTAILPWFVPFNELWDWGTKTQIIQALLVASVALIIVVVIFVLQKYTKEIDQEDDKTWSKAGIIIGFFGILLTLLPVTFTGRSVSIFSTFNRYTLNSVASVAILVISSLYYFINRIKPIYLFVASILFLSVFIHFLNIVRYKENYQDQNDFWWQLSWRAPNLEDGTVFTPLGLNVMDYFHIFPQVNLIYRPDSKDLQISAQILNSETIQEILVSGNPKEYNLRGIAFQRDYKKLLIVSKKENSCLRVWDGSNVALTAIHNPIISLVAPYSNLSTIDTKSEDHLPPEVFFGKEPAHSWCFYYQKASLAQQQGDWNKVIQLGLELNSQKLHPLDISEWMPFFEGYSNMHMAKDAEDVALRMKSDLITVNLICRSFTAEKPVWYEKTNDDVYEFMKKTLCG